MFWNRAKTPPPPPTAPLAAPQDAGKRDHLYVFAHRALPELCQADPLQIFGVFASPDRDRFLSWMWATVEKRLGKPIAGFDPLDLAVSTFKLKDMPTIIIRLPAPIATAEAYFVGMVLTVGVQDASAPRKALARYFTLELGAQADATPRTVLCEWADGAHRNYGDGPPATLEHFAAAIRERLQVHGVPR